LNSLAGISPYSGTGRNSGVSRSGSCQTDSLAFIHKECCKYKIKPGLIKLKRKEGQTSWFLSFWLNNVVLLFNLFQVYSHLNEVEK
jgi:hypothetical protein